jgi:hypothetical protein
LQLYANAAAMIPSLTWEQLVWEIPNPLLLQLEIEHAHKEGYICEDAAAVQKESDNLFDALKQAGWNPG